MDLFRRKELYMTSFDVEQLILNVFSENYINSMHKIMKILFQYSSVYFISHFPNIDSQELKYFYKRIFEKMINEYKSYSSSKFVNLKLINFHVPFILPKFEEINKFINSKETDIRNIFGEYTSLMTKQIKKNEVNMCAD